MRAHRLASDGGCAGLCWRSAASMVESKHFSEEECIQERERKAERKAERKRLTTVKSRHMLRCEVGAEDTAETACLACKEGDCSAVASRTTPHKRQKTRQRR